MKYDNRSPFTLGMEVEQFPNAVTPRARNYTMSNDHGTLRDWHNDASGPRETTLGPYKQGKSILNQWFKDTRDEDITWDWHASHRGSGAGSHVHLCVAEDVFDDTVEAWTISYNTCVELFPFFAPFFCHNWEDGFRDGSDYGTRLAVERWASGTTRRFSTESVRERTSNPTRYGRDYKSVTFNGARTDGKPLTIELRANDAHPAMALPGVLQLRRVVGRAVESGWSPKLENHDGTLMQCYDKIYERASEVGLLTAMQEPIAGGITFAEGRGIPGVDRREFDTMYEVFKACQRTPYTCSADSWVYRAKRLALSGRDEYSPHNNIDALWNIDAPKGEHEWANGPESYSPKGSSDSDDEGSDAAAGATTGRAMAADGGEN